MNLELVEKIDHWNENGKIEEVKKKTKVELVWNLKKVKVTHFGWVGQDQFNLT